jgi:hypothetical protein
MPTHTKPTDMTSHAKTPHPTHTTRLALILATSTTVLLTACGGGGDSGDSGTGTPTGFDTRTLQGRWATASGVTPGYTALVVPDDGSSTTATAWVLAQDASRLVKVSATSTQSANGKSYDLATPANAPTDITTGSYSANLTASPKSVSFTNVLGTSLTLSQSDTLSGIAAYADAAGTWKASAGAVDLTWTLTDTGTMTGSSTSGCSYSGNTTTPTSITLYRVSFSETCSAATSSFTGIATLSADKTRLTVTATTTDDAKGSALFFVKQ